MIPARPLYPGGCGSVWDPEPSKERVGDWGGPATVWSLLCVAERVPQGRTERGGIVLAANAGPRVPSGGVTLKRRCTYRPSVIYLIVNKLLSLARAHSFFNLSLVLAAYLAFLCVRARTHARARIHKTIQPAGPRRIFAVVRILLEACPNGN